MYEILGLDDYYMRFSTWDPTTAKGQEKFVDDPEAWESRRTSSAHAMVETGVPFVEGKGEAAFYGPKIDLQFRTVDRPRGDREHQPARLRAAGAHGPHLQGADNRSTAPTSSTARRSARTSASSRS